MTLKMAICMHRNQEEFTYDVYIVVSNARTKASGIVVEATKLPCRSTGSWVLFWTGRYFCHNPILKFLRWIFFILLQNKPVSFLKVMLDLDSQYFKK